MLQEVNKAISFIGEKFDAYEAVSKMNERIGELESKIDHQKQYTRQNFILIHRIAENKEENTDQQAIDFINNNQRNN